MKNTGACSPGIVAGCIPASAANRDLGRGIGANRTMPASHWRKHCGKNVWDIEVDAINPVIASKGRCPLLRHYIWCWLLVSTNPLAWCIEAWLVDLSLVHEEKVAGTACIQAPIAA